MTLMIGMEIFPWLYNNILWDKGCNLITPFVSLHCKKLEYGIID